MNTYPNSKKQEQQHKDAAVKPDEETLHTTDPQENMRGPVSSFIQGVKHVAEENDKESKQEADQKREEKM